MSRCGWSHNTWSAKAVLGCGHGADLYGGCRRARTLCAAVTGAGGLHVPGARVLVSHHGQTACIPTPQGAKLARCEMVLNVASWKFLDGPCPLASIEDLTAPNRAQGRAPHHPLNGFPAYCACAVCATPLRVRATLAPCPSPGGAVLACRGECLLVAGLDDRVAGAGEPCHRQPHQTFDRLTAYADSLEEHVAELGLSADVPLARRKLNQRAAWRQVLLSALAEHEHAGKRDIARRVAEIRGGVGEEAARTARIGGDGPGMPF